ncbi:hypothetical protein FOA52_005845 [Chlamydomonas sp. UWO 241]|nr:hypothetical protein FOA52_005845 [Chlamydomonas sp. UWO 241]
MAAAAGAQLEGLDDQELSPLVPHAHTRTDAQQPKPPLPQPHTAFQPSLSRDADAAQAAGGGGALLRALCDRVWASGPICSALAALLFAFNSFMVKMLGGRIPSTEIVLVRSLISLVLCAWAAAASDIHPLFGQRKHYPILLLRGVFGAGAMQRPCRHFPTLLLRVVFGAGAMQVFYVALVKLPLADAVTLFFFSPAVTTIAAWLFLNEVLGLRGVGGVLLSLCGLIVLTRPPMIFGDASTLVWDLDRTIGTTAALVSAFLAAAAFITIRKIGDREHSLVLSMWFHTTGLVTSVIPLTIGWPDKPVLPGPADAACLFLIGLTSFSGQITLSRGFQVQPAAMASAINFLQVPLSYLLNVLFLHDPIEWLAVLGGLLIAGGALLVNLRPKPQAEATVGAGPSPPTQAGAEAVWATLPTTEDDHGDKEALLLPGVGSSTSVSGMESREGGEGGGGGGGGTGVGVPGVGLGGGGGASNVGGSGRAGFGVSVSGIGWEGGGGGRGGGGSARSGASQQEQQVQGQQQQGQAQQQEQKQAQKQAQQQGQQQQHWQQQQEQQQWQQMEVEEKQQTLAVEGAKEMVN